jgi:hypothetical protein
MANVKIEIDTSKQTEKVTVNGKSIGNISEVFYSANSGPIGFRVEIMQREDMDDMRKVTRLVANELGELVKDDTLAIQHDISTYLQKKWCKI